MKNAQKSIEKKFNFIKIFTRYERGLEDYEEAINSMKHSLIDKQEGRQFSDGVNPMQQMLNIIGTLFTQSLKTASKTDQESRIGAIDRNGTNNSDDNETTTDESEESKNLKIKLHYILISSIPYILIKIHQIIFGVI